MIHKRIKSAKSIFKLERQHRLNLQSEDEFNYYEIGKMDYFDMLSHSLQQLDIILIWYLNPTFAFKIIHCYIQYIHTMLLQSITDSQSVSPHMLFTAKLLSQDQSVKTYQGSSDVIIQPLLRQSVQREQGGITIWAVTFRKQIIYNPRLGDFKKQLIPLCCSKKKKITRKWFKIEELIGYFFPKRGYDPLSCNREG